jgi:hypothetical protein
VGGRVSARQGKTLSRLRAGGGGGDGESLKRPRSSSKQASK